MTPSVCSPVQQFHSASFNSQFRRSIVNAHIRAFVSIMVLAFMFVMAIPISSQTFGQEEMPPLKLVLTNINEDDKLRAESTFECKLEIDAQAGATVPKQYIFKFVRTSKDKSLSGEFVGDVKHLPGSKYTCSAQMKVPKRVAKFNLQVEALPQRIERTKEETISIETKVNVIKE